MSGIVRRLETFSSAFGHVRPPVAGSERHPVSPTGVFTRKGDKIHSPVFHEQIMLLRLVTEQKRHPFALVLSYTKLKCLCVDVDQKVDVCPNASTQLLQYYATVTLMTVDLY